ncbi:substrate-binding domain-containing protein [Streptomyces phaeochromogenes]|uniref:substrate-binding domain-containing protein n=1 Tax=Streptomyces phaeochromogenes TaxID=1923 RepID=UPI003594533D
MWQSPRCAPSGCGPQELAVIGFDDTPHGALFRPAPTTVPIDAEAIGRIAALRALNLPVADATSACRNLRSSRSAGRRGPAEWRRLHGAGCAALRASGGPGRTPDEQPNSRLDGRHVNCQ